MSDQYSIMSQEELLTEVERLTALVAGLQGTIKLQAEGKYAAVEPEIERLTEAFDLADGLRKSHQAEIVRLNDALKDAQTDNLNLRRHRNELRKRVVALEEGNDAAKE